MPNDIGSRVYLGVCRLQDEGIGIQGLETDQD
jgi:hypothetical protein